jgi:hypothetical protein
VGDVAWPNIPFYIAQRVFSVGLPPNSITAVTLTKLQDQGYVIGYPALISGDPRQLWIAVPDPLGVGTSIQNLLTGQILVADKRQPQSWLPGDHWVTIAPASSGLPNRFWALDDYPGGGEVRIYCVPWSLNWFMQLTPSMPGNMSLPWVMYPLLGWGDSEGGIRNCIFKIFPETGKITISDVIYQIASAVTNTLNVLPVSFMSEVVDNTGATALTQTITLSGSITETTNFDTSNSDTTATKLTTTMPLELGLINVVLKVTGTGSVSEDSSRTVQWSNGQTESHTENHAIETTVTVPAGKKYSYQQSINYEVFSASLNRSHDT